ncbi:aldehyde dehydrogenase [Conidiobolus coronatus NRRL 28638]|uniref:Aldehyde dehydrogenase n=1 Tax=Conidiobolus coronatus (strain ATCC 28846 / CBS 209.66 / NRRL 28638) TaxID=796925 RepID=A0A137NYC8_CONC2|nr:aldehyde dehydrogenase [Conidiobolus coronatus NRRL 28638]|eukprot:KXN67873.1 aldehyde dehydrogenase [Conidiobolus coronatus NRRL 28638]
MATYSSGVLINIPNPTPQDIINLPRFTSSNIEEIAHDRRVLHQSYLSGKTRSYEWRLQNLKNLRQLVLDNQERICYAASTDFKAIPLISQEISQFLNELESCMENLASWMKPQNHSSSWSFLGSKAKVIREPLGTVLVISPWNFPLLLSLDPFMGAISAGNCAVLKPSELTPNLSALFADLFPKYLDPECFRVYNGGPEVATELLKQKWDHIFYTGNGAIAKIVMRAAAEYLTPVTLELGGKSPAVVDLDTIDVNNFAKRLYFGKLLNSGQVCVAIDYILCKPHHVEPIINAFKAIIEECLGKEPLKSPYLQKIVNERHLQRLLNLLPTENNTLDGEIALGGNYNFTEQKLEPTIIINPDPENSKIMKEEVFGPILPIIAMDNFSDCFDYIKSHDKPLASYLFSNDAKLISKFTEEISSGGQTINDSIIHVFHPTLPFGGVGSSGIGAYHAEHTFKLFSHQKGVVQKDWSATKLDKLKLPPADLSLVKAVSFPKILRPSVVEVGFATKWWYSLCMTFTWIIIMLKLVYGGNNEGEKVKKD